MIAHDYEIGKLAVPVRLGPLIGREREVHALRDLLMSGEPLVTVTGLSGVGKSRLVREAVGDLLAAWFRADAFDDPEALLLAIGQWAESRLTKSDARSPLIAIDSFDDPSIGPDLMSVLDRFPNIRVVATSRQRLNVQGETLFRLLPLSYPRVGGQLSATRPDEWAAVQCFLRSARRISPGFQLDSSNSETLAELMELSGGLPLAIELTAQWLRVCDLDELVVRARRSLELYSGGSADLPAHQQDLRASIRSTIDELGADDAEVVEVLAQLGPVSRAGLEAGLGHAVPLDLLARLIDRNIVEGWSAGHAITLHPLIRQEVAVRTDGSDVRCRFLKWVHTQLADVVPHLSTVRSRDAFRQMDELADDIAAALDLLPKHPDLVAGVIVLQSEYWRAIYSPRVEEYWTIRALSMIGDTSSHSAHLQLAACRALMYSGSPDAQTRGQRAVELARQAGDQRLLAEAVATMNTMRYNAGQPVFDDDVSQAIDTCRVNGWSTTLCDLLTVRAFALHPSGRVAEGRQVAIQVVDAARAAGDLYWTAVGLLALSDIEMKLGHYDEALRTSNEASGLADILDNRCPLASVVNLGRAAAYLEGGDVESAVVAFRTAVRGFEEIESAVGLAQALRDLGHCLACVGNHEEAQAVFTRSIELWKALDQTFLALVTLLTVVVSAAPVPPSNELCAHVFNAIDGYAPGFTEQRGGYWARLLELRRADLANTQLAGPAPSLDELIDLVLAHLRPAPVVQPPLGLTQRESVVLIRIARGATDREIASDLHLSVRTVNAHVAAILRKLGVEDRRQAAVWYRDNPFAGA